MFEQIDFYQQQPSRRTKLKQGVRYRQKEKHIPQNQKNQKNIKKRSNQVVQKSLSIFRQINPYDPDNFQQLKPLMSKSHAQFMQQFGSIYLSSTNSQQARFGIIASKMINFYGLAKQKIQQAGSTVSLQVVQRDSFVFQQRVRKIVCTVSRTLKQNQKLFFQDITKTCILMLAARYAIQSLSPKSIRVMVKSSFMTNNPFTATMFLYGCVDYFLRYQIINQVPQIPKVRNIVSKPTSLIIGDKKLQNGDFCIVDDLGMQMAFPIPFDKKIQNWDKIQNQIAGQQQKVIQVHQQVQAQTQRVIKKIQLTIQKSAQIKTEMQGSNSEACKSLCTETRIEINSVVQQLNSQAKKLQQALNFGQQFQENQKQEVLTQIRANATLINQFITSFGFIGGLPQQKIQKYPQSAKRYIYIHQQGMMGRYIKLIDQLAKSMLKNNQRFKNLVLVNAGQLDKQISQQTSKIIQKLRELVQQSIKSLDGIRQAAQTVVLMGNKNDQNNNILSQQDQENSNNSYQILKKQSQNMVLVQISNDILPKIQAFGVALQNNKIQIAKFKPIIQTLMLQQFSLMKNSLVQSMLMQFSALGNVLALLGNRIVQIQTGINKIFNTVTQIKSKMQSILQKLTQIVKQIKQVKIYLVELSTVVQRTFKQTKKIGQLLNQMFQNQNGTRQLIQGFIGKQFVQGNQQFNKLMAQYNQRLQRQKGIYETQKQTLTTLDQISKQSGLFSASLNNANKGIQNNIGYSQDILQTQSQWLDNFQIKFKQMKQSINNLLGQKGKNDELLKPIQALLQSIQSISAQKFDGVKLANISNTIKQISSIAQNNSLSSQAIKNFSQTATKMSQILSLIPSINQTSIEGTKKKISTGFQSLQSLLSTQMKSFQTQLSSKIQSIPLKSLEQQITKIKGVGGSINDALNGTYGSGGVNSQIGKITQLGNMIQEATKGVKSKVTSFDGIGTDIANQQQSLKNILNSVGTTSQALKLSAGTLPNLFKLIQTNLSSQKAKVTDQLNKYIMQNARLQSARKMNANQIQLAQRQLKKQANDKAAMFQGVLTQILQKITKPTGSYQSMISKVAGQVSKYDGIAIGALRDLQALKVNANLVNTTDFNTISNKISTLLQIYNQVATLPQIVNNYQQTGQLSLLKLNQLKTELQKFQQGLNGLTYSQQAHQKIQNVLSLQQNASQINLSGIQDKIQNLGKIYQIIKDQQVNTGSILGLVKQKQEINKAISSSKDLYKKSLQDVLTQNKKRQQTIKNITETQKNIDFPTITTKLNALSSIYQSLKNSPTNTLQQIAKRQSTVKQVYRTKQQMLKRMIDGQKQRQTNLQNNLLDTQQKTSVILKSHQDRYNTMFSLGKELQTQKQKIQEALNFQVNKKHQLESLIKQLQKNPSFQLFTKITTLVANMTEKQISLVPISRFQNIQQQINQISQQIKKNHGGDGGDDPNNPYSGIDLRNLKQQNQMLKKGLRTMFNFVHTTMQSEAKFFKGVFGELAKNTKQQQTKRQLDRFAKLALKGYQKFVQQSLGVLWEKQSLKRFTSIRQQYIRDYPNLKRNFIDIFIA